MHENLIRLRDDALAELGTAADADALEAWRVRYLSRKGGALTTAMGVLGTLPREERPAYGQAANEVKNALEAAFAERQDGLKAAALAAELAAGTVDITLPGRPPSVGHLHVTTQNLRQLYAVFAGMGFEVYDGPDVETDDYNFGLLNIPAYHPARDMWDTFWVSQNPNPDPAERTLVMRTHTAPVRFASCASAAPSRSAWCCPARSTATSRSRCAPSISSTRWRDWPWARASA